MKIMFCRETQKAGEIDEQLKMKRSLLESCLVREYRGTEGQNNFCRGLCSFLFILLSFKFHLDLKIIEASK